MPVAVAMDKKIVIIGPAYPLRGGLAAYDERLAKAFQSQQWKVCIYTFSLQYPKFLFPGKTQYSSDPPPRGLNIKVCINAVNPFNWIRVGRELKRAAPDMIVVRYWLPFMGPCLGTILRVAKKNRRTRVVCIADNIIPHEKRPGDNLFTRYFLRSADGFITMSEKVLADLRSIEHKKPARFVPHPLYDNFGEPVAKKESRQNLGIAEDQRIVLFFGFIRKYKGLDILLDAMKIVKEKTLLRKLPSVKLLVAGEFYEDANPYLQQIRDNEIEDWVILRTDFVPDSQVKYYLCAADAVIQPYRNATQSGVTPLAYHFEKPMIVTNVGGLPAMVPDGRAGLVAEPDAVDIAEKIIEFYERGEESFIAGLRLEKKKYAWENLVQAIEEISGLPLHPEKNNSNDL